MNRYTVFDERHTEVAYTRMETGQVPIYSAPVGRYGADVVGYTTGTIHRLYSTGGVLLGEVVLEGFVIVAYDLNRRRLFYSCQ